MRLVRRLLKHLANWSIIPEGFIRNLNNVHEYQINTNVITKIKNMFISIPIYSCKSKIHNRIKLLVLQFRSIEFGVKDRQVGFYSEIFVNWNMSVNLISIYFTLTLYLWRIMEKCLISRLFEQWSFAWRLNSSSSVTLTQLGTMKWIGGSIVLVSRILLILDSRDFFAAS